MIYVLHAGLLMIAFVIMLNGFLQGGWKRRIDALLGVSLVLLLAIAFWAFGWKYGLASVAAAMGYALISRPVAGHVATRLLSIRGGASGAYVGLPPRALLRLSRELAGRSEGKEVSVQDLYRELVSGSDRRERAREALLDYCLRSPATNGILREHGVTRATLADIYSTLSAVVGVWASGHYVPASALAYPHTLEFLISSRAAGWSHLDQAYALLMHFQRGQPLPLDLDRAE